MFERRFQDSPPRPLLVQILADAPVNLPTAHHFFRLPLVEHALHHFFDVIEIDFGLQRIVNAVVPRLEQLLVVHLRVITEVRVTRGLYQAVGHQRTR